MEDFAETTLVELVYNESNVLSEIDIRMEDTSIEQLIDNLGVPSQQESNIVLYHGNNYAFMFYPRQSSSDYNLSIKKSLLSLERDTN